MLDRILDRTVSVTMVLLVFVVLGAVSIGRLPVSLIPDVDIPFVTVQVSAPDLSAREMDDVVVRPLRQSLVQINHLDDLSATSRDGSATITLTLEEGQDVDFFFIEVNERIDRAMPSLPDIPRPRVFKASATDIPAFYINITLKDDSGGDFMQMSDFARDVISKRIEQLDEVAMVDISGCTDREVLIVPDERKLESLGITLEEFESSISAANVSLSNLTIRDGEYHYSVKFRSFASSAEDIAEVYFRAGDRLLQIGDVAEVTQRPAERTGLARSDGKDAVVLAVVKQSEARMAELRRSISGQLEVFGRDYPDLEFTVTRDQTELLEYSISNLIVNIVVAIVLVCIVIFLFMKDFRSPLLVAAAIPVSLVISFFVLDLMGVTINIISLSGILLGVGMMVDNSIVLVDNITARWNKGEPLRSAVTGGAKEVSGAMLSSVLTTCAVFIPLIFMNGLAGDIFFDQAVSITVVLLVAHMVTVMVIPVYYWALYRRFSSFRPSRLLAKMNFGAGMRLYDIIEDWFLRNKNWIVWSLPLASVAAAGVCLAFMEKEKLPPVTYTDTILNIDWNELVTIEENERRVASLEQLLEGRCSQLTALVGTQQFVLSHSGDQTIGESSLYIKCTDAEQLEETKVFLAEHIGRTWPLSVYGWSNSGNIFEMVFAEREPQLVARLRPTGDSGLQVRDVEEAVAAVRAAGPEWPVDEIQLKQDIVYVSDPALMSLYGVSFADLRQLLANALNGNTLFEIVQGNRSVPVVLGTDSGEIGRILSESFIEKKDDDGNTVRIPASALMRQTVDQDFKQIVSGGEGGYYPLALDIPGAEVPETMAAVEDAVRGGEDFDVSWSGAWFSNRELVRQMMMILLVAVLLLYLILASQFESLVQPLIILSEIVIDVGFSLAILWIFGVSINLMSLIGLVVISGIVINDSILKVDTINRLVAGGMEVGAAIHEAGHRRVKAILMTSITTVFSVLPFLSRGSMGNDLQYPMAIVITVGMTIGTVVSIFFIPAVYSRIYAGRRR